MKSLFNSICLFLGGLLLAQCTFSQNIRDDQDDFIAGLEAEIKSKMDQYGVIGASIALIDDQEVLWSQGFGFTDKTKARKVDSETLFSVQSLSKTYLATATLMEVTKGNLDLDVPIKNYYPEFRINSRFNDKDYEKITIRHLLSHRSGLLQEAPIGNNYDTIACSFDEHIKSFATSWLRFPVGKFFSYSNMGMDLVGYILSKRSDTSYAHFMDKNLISPLGMSNTTFSQSKAFISDNIAKGYFGENEMPRTLIVPLAAGGMYSSVSDMAKFISFQLRGCTVNGNTTISRELIREMHTVQYAMEGQSAGYGLGTYLKPFHGATLVYHNGGGYGYSTRHMWIPEYKVGLVILSNDGNGSPFVREISQLALNVLLQRRGITKNETETENSKEKPHIKLSASYLESLTGSYKGNGNIIQVFIKNQKLAVLKYGRTLLLNAISENEFSSEDGQRFIFTLDDPAFPKHIVHVNPDNADFYIFNDNGIDKPGVVDSGWQSITGTYAGFSNWQPIELQIFANNGYLYTSFMSYGGATKIHPYSTNLSYTSDGESVIVDKDKIYIGSRMFTKR